MKSIFSIILLSGGICLCTACHTGSSVRQGKDTVKNHYGSANDTSGSADRTVDTSKVTTKTGEASSLDNSASGGTKIARDTATKTKK
jgi:hypothetical protein